MWRGVADGLVAGVVPLVLALGCGRTELHDEPVEAGVDLACHPGSPPRVLASWADVDSWPWEVRVDATRAFVSSPRAIVSMPLEGGESTVVVPNPDVDAGWTFAAIALTPTSLVVQEWFPGTTPYLFVVSKEGGAREPVNTGDFGWVDGCVAVDASVLCVVGSQSVARFALDGSPPVEIVSAPLGMSIDGLFVTSSNLYALVGLDSFTPSAVTTYLRLSLSNATTTVISGPTPAFADSVTQAPNGLFVVEPGPHTPYNWNGTSQIEFLADAATSFVHIPDLPCIVGALSADTKYLYTACFDGPLLRTARDGTVTTVASGFFWPHVVANDDACIYVADVGSVVRYSKP